MSHRLVLLVAALASALGLLIPASAIANPRYEVMNAPEGVYWRSEPNWAAAERIAGFGVYNGTIIEVQCYQSGTAVEGSADTMWEQATDVGGSGYGSGWVNEHFINDGQPINQASPGVPPCSASSAPPPASAPPPSPTAPKPTCYGDYCSGKSATKTNCAIGAVTVASNGKLSLIWSARCKTKWAQMAVPAGWWGPSEIWAEQSTGYTQSAGIGGHYARATTVASPMIYSPRSVFLRGTTPRPAIAGTPNTLAVDSVLSQESAKLKAAPFAPGGDPGALSRLLPRRRRAGGILLSSKSWAKGKRNRENRELREPSTDDLIKSLVEIEGETEFLGFLGRHPCCEKPILDEIAARMDGSTRGLYFARWRRLLLAAQDDPVLAWAEHATFRAASEEAAHRLARDLSDLATAEEAREHQRAIDIAEGAVPQAIEAELTPAVAEFEAARARQFFLRPDGDRAENVDQAIAGYGRALQATADPEKAAHHQMRLAIAIAEKTNGDPVENLEASVNALREALDYLPRSASLDLRTMIQTNLASALLRRPGGEKVANLYEALEISRDVLRYRSIEREPNEWAYIQLNYAPILEQLSEHGEVEREEALDAYLEVVEAGELIEDRHLANAHFQLGRVLCRAGAFDPERFVEEWDPDSGSEKREREEVERTQWRERARDHLQIAVDLLDSEQRPIDLGRAYLQLAEVLHELDRSEEAIDAGRKGVELLPPTTDPRASAQVAGRLGELLAKRLDWEGAAAAYRVAVEAGELAFYRNLDVAQRESVANSTTNLTRFAAFALAAAGETPEATMVLESGRAREMRERLGLGDTAAAQLSQLPPELRDAYVEATNELARTHLGEAGAEASRTLQRVLREIREIDGFEQFGTRADPSDLLAALEPDWPLLYVDPTPFGTLLLLVEQTSEGATVDGHFLDTPTALEIFMRLLSGSSLGSEDFDEGEFGSFLAGASGFSGQDRDVQKDVEDVLPWIGETLAAPIAELLSEVGARGVTLVCCGPIGLAPLHAAPRPGISPARYLIDDFEVRYSPSGAFAAASLSRAREREADALALLALTDPKADLDAAQPEVETIAALFEHHQIARQDEATWSYLRAHAGDASHVHLACHAMSAEWGETRPAIQLADGPVFAPQLTELAELPARLVTVSACQSAVADITHLPEEGISVGSVLLAAGAACVIASLWPVRDDTTAMLMTRLYEEMIRGGLRPPEALRRAQLWLRDLTDAAADEFLERYPALRAEFRRRAALGDRPGNRDSGVTRRGATTRPYSSPDYWAPFIAVGA